MDNPFLRTYKRILREKSIDTIRQHESTYPTPTGFIRRVMALVRNWWRRLCWFVWETYCWTVGIKPNLGTHLWHLGACLNPRNYRKWAKDLFIFWMKGTPLNLQYPLVFQCSGRGPSDTSKTAGETKRPPRSVFEKTSLVVYKASLIIILDEVKGGLLQNEYIDGFFPTPLNETGGKWTMDHEWLSPSLTFELLVFLYFSLIGKL